MSVTRLILVRHGETEWNRCGRMQGHDDSPLTAAGRAQAEAVARRLSDMNCTALYHSGLGRTRATAAPIAAATGLEPRVDLRLRERALGIFEGLTRDQIRKRHARHYASFVAREPDFAVPRGESLRELSRRITACLDELARENAGATIVAVSHGGVLDAFYRRVTGTPIEAPRRFSLRNASINRFHHDGECWRLETWGYVDHLQSLGVLDEQ